MKKFIAGVAGAVLMSAGFVATAGVAHADPYTGTYNTSTKAKVPSKVRAGKVALCGKVTVQGSNATPRGTLTFYVEPIGGGETFSKSVAYSGGKVCVTKRLSQGTYVLKVSFSSPSTSNLNDSSDSKGFRVVSRRG